MKRVLCGTQNEKKLYYDLDSIPNEEFLCIRDLQQKNINTHCIEQYKRQHGDKNLHEMKEKNNLQNLLYQCRLQKILVFRHFLEKQQQLLFYNLPENHSNKQEKN